MRRQSKEANRLHENLHIISKSPSSACTARRLTTAKRIPFEQEDIISRSRLREGAELLQPAGGWDERTVNKHKRTRSEIPAVLQTQSQWQRCVRSESCGFSLVYSSTAQLPESTWSTGLGLLKQLLRPFIWKLSAFSRQKLFSSIKELDGSASLSTFQ